MTTAADLHTAMFDAIQARDFDTLQGLFDSRSVHVSGDGVEKRGPDPVVDEVTTFTTAFPDLIVTIRRQHVSDDTVSVIEYTFSGTHHGDLGGLAPTGKKIAVVACSVLEADSGTIKREADYFDTSALLAQLGQ